MSDSIPSWQKILAQGYSSAEELLADLKLPATLAHASAEKQFKTRLPRGFARLMEPGNSSDPLLLQVLAVQEEFEEALEFGSDPLGEKATNPLKGLLHKYHGRVLLTLSGACAIHCRYCFRRHFPYENNNPGREGWAAVYNYIHSDSTIQEVILSGGDPLLATDKVIFEVCEQLQSIAHVKTIRFHSRIPVVLPERIDDNFIQKLSAMPLQKVMVLHTNHPREIDERVMSACKQLRAAGCQLLNQSVLLRKINDDEFILKELSERLFDCGVLPYYLHLLDKVQGAAHFDVSLDKALSIHKKLQALLPGYLVPRLAREESGKANKTLLF
jgi:EF-P beta-lysylation protein EpmB